MDKDTGKTQGNTTPNDEMDAAGATNNTSDSKVKSSSYTIFQNKKVMLILGIAGAALLVLALWLFLLAEQRESQDDPEDAVLFTINDSEFRESDISEYIVDLENRIENEEEVIEIIREALVIKIAAEEHDIEVTEAELEEMADSLPAYESIMLAESPWLRLLSTRLVAEDKIRNLLDDASDTEGYVFTYYFGSLIEDPYVDTEQPGYEPLPGTGDESLIDEDRNHARTVVEGHREALRAGELTPEQILEEIHNDERLHYHYIIPTREDSYSRQFGADSTIDWRVEVAPQQVDFIDSQSSVEEVSDIQVGTIPTEDDEVEAYYYFIYLTEIDEQRRGIISMLESNGVEVL